MSPMQPSVRCAECQHCTRFKVPVLGRQDGQKMSSLANFSVLFECGFKQLLVRVQSAAGSHLEFHPKMTTASYKRIQLFASSCCGRSSCRSASITSSPGTKRGPVREKYALAFTAYALPFSTALTCFQLSGNWV